MGKKHPKGHNQGQKIVNNWRHSTKRYEKKNKIAAVSWFKTLQLR